MKVVGLERGYLVLGEKVDKMTELFGAGFVGLRSSSMDVIDKIGKDTTAKKVEKLETWRCVSWQIAR